ncbi:hypothetical protein Q8F55_006366 [Vanrija albida]|uniref:Amino acid permease/ SLC12A domain-containing protein n=1 Tax=Vanrija albida TaxID=181172 RepID=A0ABR3PWZ3_9TREE
MGAKQHTELEAAPQLPAHGVEPAAHDLDLELAASADEKRDRDTGDEGNVLSAAEGNLKRGLGQRHLSMLALAGAIDGGFFLSLGGSISTGGPLGALLAYIFIGAVVCSVQFAVGEVSAFMPVTGSFVRHAEVLVDPACSFALGWNLVYGNWLSVPSEIVAICVLFQYWTDLNSSVFIVVFMLLTAAVAYSGIRVFGELEFGFALLKIALIVALILYGLITSLGGIKGVDRIGFRYWRSPGPFVPHIAEGAWGQFLGFWSVLIYSVFSFAGVESVAMAAAEVRSPRQAIPKAVRRVFVRVTLFYVLSVLVIGMIVPSDDPRIAEDAGTAATSPFLIAAQAAGNTVWPSIVNAVVITSAWSSGNQALLAGSRVLYGLAVKRHAPAVFLRTNRFGVPYVAVTTNVAFAALAFMSLSNTALTVFYWFLNIVGCGVLISWSAILINHLRLRAAFRVQRLDPAQLPWYNSWTVISSSASLALCSILLLTNGFVAFTKGNWSTSTFITAYIDLAVVGTLFVIWKLVRRTKFVRLQDIPLESMLEHIARTPEPPLEKSKGWVRFVSWLWD